MITMNKFKMLALLAAVSASLSFNVQAEPAGEAVALNRVVAVVNSDVITNNELTQRAHAAALNLRRQNIQLPNMQQLRGQVLEQLIMERAIEQRARETGVRVDDALINATIEQIARQNKISVAEMRRQLDLDGVTFPEFREQIRSQLIAQRLREREVNAKIKIPESEIDAFLAEQAGFNINDTKELHVAHIFIPVSKSMSSEAMNEAKKTAQMVFKKVKAGEDFGQLAATYSKADDALNGGDLGWRTISQMPSQLASSVRDAQNEPSRVAMDIGPDGYTIVKVLARRDGVQNKLTGGPVTQTHVRHILMAITPVTPEAVVLDRINTIYSRLVNQKEDFETLARLNSVDSSATRGGDIGWVQTGDVVPEFEKAMNQLQPGQISEPVRTQFGYHIIQVIDRKKEAMNADRLRYMARQMLSERKVNEATIAWQRELRDRAFVELRPDVY